MNLLFLFVALALCCSGVVSQTQEYDVRNTALGAVKGIVNGTKCRSWRGVPFAASTAALNRFMPPTQREKWNNTLDATKFGAGCPQIHGGVDTPTNSSEDCLNVNVFAPYTSQEGSLLPVMLFFYGGTFIEGWNEGPFDLYDGCIMTNTGNALIVTANYRLGAMGYLVTDKLKGNQGFLDQRMAMEWVQENIANFGGDPKQVTIFGESAGACSVGLHTISPGSKGLFKYGIMESNFPSMAMHTNKQAIDMGMKFCSDKALNCTVGHIGMEKCDVQCIQNAPLVNVRKAWSRSSGNFEVWVLENYQDILQGMVGFGPTVDGDVIPEHLITAYEKGMMDPDSSILFGTNTGEGVTFIYSMGLKSLPMPALPAVLTAMFGKKNAPLIFSRYRQLYPNMTAGLDLLSQIGTDYGFRCSSNYMAEMMTKHGGSAYVYQYNHIFSGSYIFPHFGLPDQCVDIACHMSEIPFVFGNDVPCLNATFTPDEQTLAKGMMQFWTNFAANGDPNKGPSIEGWPEWPVWEATDQPDFMLDMPPVVQHDMADICPFWDAIGYTPSDV